MFIEAKDGGGGDNWTSGAISRAKLQSNDHNQQTNIQFFTGRMPFLSPNQQCQSTEGENTTVHGLAYPKLTWGLPTLSLTTNSSWLPWRRLPCLSSALRCQYPLYRVSSSNACIYVKHCPQVYEVLDFSCLLPCCYSYVLIFAYVNYTHKERRFKNY